MGLQRVRHNWVSEQQQYMHKATIKISGHCSKVVLQIVAGEEDIMSLDLQESL